MTTATRRNNSVGGITSLDPVVEAAAISLIMTDPDFRRHYFKNDFEAFFDYHYGWPDKAPFHHIWARGLQGRKNLIFEWFRGSRKTTLVRGYVVWCALYEVEPYIIVTSSEDTLSGEWVRNVAKMMMTPSIIRDYGIIFPLTIKKEDFQKASFKNFETTTGVKIEAKSLGQVLRGANDFSIDEGVSSRPTLLIADDIDTTDLVKNPKIVDANLKKFLGEMVGSLDQFRRRIIYLGNTIMEDGILPRLKKLHAGKKNWDIFWQPLINPDGSNSWPLVFSNEVVEGLRDEGQIAFQQNYELVPLRDGQSVIPRTSLRFARQVPEWSRIVFGIDPAFSEKTNTDSMALTIAAHIGVQRYIIAVYEFKGAEKNEEKFCTFVEQIYHRWKCSIIRIEANNGGGIIGSLLKKRNLAVEIITASRDKLTRLLEQEGRFSRGEIYFLPGTEAAQDQLVTFPNAEHDDMVDSIVYAIDQGTEYFTGVIE